MSMLTSPRGPADIPPGHWCPPPSSVHVVTVASFWQPVYDSQVASPMSKVTIGVVPQPFRSTQPTAVSATDAAPPRPLPLYGTTKSLVPWNCMTGTGRDGVHASTAIVPETGPIAAI